ncbi:MAG: RdgB/HAM1 family non-canonical purine NTP pyrophosphatase [Firmicutes bacterium]|nr:RdgB/HAM1 family non-canonical purine NTP pyrophosphatase [Candidatus Caballimonas caccae]
MEKVIVVATSNQGKLKEFREILTGYKIISAFEAGFNGEIEETGKTFYENALIKAKAVSTALNLPALADDSGLMVECLNGAPGIYSARYAGDGVDAHNIDLLLKNMEGQTNRKAKFVSCLVYYEPNGNITKAEGESIGEITTERKGNFGFGYDPVFYSYELKRVYGECEKGEKNTVSHRYKALMKLKELLENKE